MKKTALILGISAILFSCSSSDKQQDNTLDSASTNVQNSDPNVANSANGTSSNQSGITEFNIDNIPYSSSDIGDFPFFNLPKGLKSMNKPFERKFDVCFFPVNGVMTGFEGRLYKINVTNEPGEEYSKRYFEKSMEDYLASVGAVKIYDGEITKEEYDRYHKQDPNKGADGDMGYQDENIKFYVIRSQNKGNIYVQFTSNNAGGKLNVLQEEAFQQTITKVTADDISKDLSEKGKAILYINFDLNKANLTADGQSLVKEIGTALNQDKSLKVSIEGHTDNSGEAALNKKLSQDRAQTVLKSLSSQSINAARLKAVGYGAEKPLVANDSEANKAKNRRVELIKVK